MFPLEIETLARLLVAEAREKSLRLVAAESCTGGLVAGAICSISGASDVFERGFVTYTNRAKSEMLGVDTGLIERHGAVSEAVVRAMAQGALAHSRAQLAVAVTGVAGPTGGSADKPVGTVWSGWATPAGLHSDVRHFAGDRAAVRSATVQHALSRLVDLLQTAPS